MKPTLGLLLGDRNGIGPEIAVRLADRAETRAAADIVLIGDPQVLAHGQAITGLDLGARQIDDPAEIADADDATLFLPFTAGANEITVGEVSAAAGKECLDGLVYATSLAQAGQIDGFVFAPLNKAAMHAGGLRHEDEMRYLQEVLAYDGLVGELNVLDNLWTSRVTSHVPISGVAALITEKNVLDGIELAQAALSAAGYNPPRLAVCGLNPHAGDGGNFGREEIEVIGPAIEKARAQGIEASGPWPCDTVFVKARDGDYDAVVTMYHDQGQIAMKLMGFGRGVTVLGGLPVPITTAGHGTAYDIAGQGIAGIESMVAAWDLCSRMAASRRTA